jgi:hypothetical protein
MMAFVLFFVAVAIAHEAPDFRSVFFGFAADESVCPSDANANAGGAGSDCDSGSGSGKKIGERIGG